MRRRVGVILLTICLVLSISPVTAFANWGAPAISVNAKYDKDTSKVTATVSLGSFKDLAAINFNLNYDDTKLTFESGASDSSVPLIFNDADSSVIATWEDPLSQGVTCSTEKTVFTVVFSVNNGANGEANFSLSDISMNDKSGENETTTAPTGSKTSASVSIPKAAIKVAAASIAAPSKGVALSDVVTVDSMAGYTGSVVWYEGKNTSDGAAVTGAAKGGQVYTAQVTLTPKAGESFASPTAVTLNGDAAKNVVPNESGNLVITKTFSATEEKEISSLAVTTQPSKKTYTHGDSFEAAGMEVKATYDDGTVDENFTGYTVQYDKGNYLKYGDDKVTVVAGNCPAEVTELTVSKKALTIEGLTATSREYDGTTNVILSGGKLVGVVEGETVTPSIPVSGTIADANKGENKAVTFTAISLSGADAGNYTITQPTVNVNIEPKDISNDDIAITLGTQETYDGTEKNVVISSVKFGSLDVTYDCTEGDKATNVESKALKISGTGNYTGEKTASWTLQKATPTSADFDLPTIETAGVDYTGNTITVAAPILKSGKEGVGEITVKYDGSTTAPVNVGSYPVTFDVAEGQNYNAVSGLSIGTLKINKIDQNPAISAAVSLKQGGNTLDLSTLISDYHGDLSFTIEEGADLASINESILTSKDTTGNIKIKVTAAGDANYNTYSSGNDAITVTITEKDTQVISVSDVTATYGDADKAIAATTSGDGELSYAVTSGDAVTVDAATGELKFVKAGEAVVTVTAAETAGYAQASKAVKIVVQKATVMVTVKNQNIYVGDSVPTLTAPAVGTHYTVTGLVGNDALAGTAVMKYQKDGIEVTPDASAVGEYAIVLSGLAEPNQDNYNPIVIKEGTLTISNKPSGGGFLPTTEKPVITVPDGVTYKLSTDGTKVTFTVADGYELVDVSVNGVSKGKVDTLAGLKTGDKVVVTTQKKDGDSTALIEAVKNTKLVARTAMSKAKGKKAVKIYWYAKDGTALSFDGYEVFRSVKRYSGFGTTPFFKTMNEKYYNTSIKKGTKYYYKVRAYKVIDGEKVYTAWSTKAWRTVK